MAPATRIVNPPSKGTSLTEPSPSPPSGGLVCAKAGRDRAIKINRICRRFIIVIGIELMLN
jgi:hypothetical protein